MELKITHSATSKQRAPALNNMDMARLYEFLTTLWIGRIDNVLKEDARDIGIVITAEIELGLYTYVTTKYVYEI